MNQDPSMSILMPILLPHVFDDNDEVVHRHGSAGFVE